jgi:hypothetical protein
MRQAGPVWLKQVNHTVNVRPERSARPQVTRGV